ncbi:MAG TPA: FAD binding domain-containing protein, partial [Anaerolineales bacterium]|nr:FAD binding domain-containing protein [Anaerolineales bacterium]
MWQNYIQPLNIPEVLALLAQHRERARVIAGATDLMLELERGVRKDIELLIDITRLPGLREIRLDTEGILHLGPLVTHNDCASSALIRARAFPLARAAWEVGAPQIRNRGTVAGNLITASPANDTITPLMAMNASIVLTSTRGRRSVALRDFYRGVRKTVMEPDELLEEITFPALDAAHRGTFVKLALRRAQAIAVVNVAVVLGLEGKKVASAAIALGSVAPTIIRASEAEAYL